jgi:drug/metabolite transporter (DMT)-like permease
MSAATPYRERLTPVRTAGVLLGFFGVAVVVLGKSDADLRVTGVGDAVPLGTMPSYVLAGVFQSQLKFKCRQGDFVAPIQITTVRAWPGARASMRPMR